MMNKYLIKRLRDAGHRVHSVAEPQANGSGLKSLCENSWIPAFAGMTALGWRP